jgi:DtxR family manganese transport transcriptional regulator
MKMSSKTNPFKVTRGHHSLESASDYTELVFDLINKNGQARTGEIAQALGVSHVTAVKSIQRLQKLGYLQTDRQKPVELTAKGKKLAVLSKTRHKLLVDFLVAIGVSAKIAEIDAEGAEHHLSKQTFDKMKEFLDK